MSSIKLKHSSGNGVSISAPDTNPSSDRTLKLPSIDADGIVATKDTSDNLVSVTGINGGKFSNRNLINNGAFNIAQYSPDGSAVNESGFKTVDRFKCQTSGVDETITQEQGAVGPAAGTPYNLGFRRSYKITNGNQTSGAGVGDLVKIQTTIEAQNVAQSGWNYTSPSSYITLQFWCKSSVSQNFYFNLISRDGTMQNYVMETGVLVADTWTKITKTIPGNANLTFENNADEGLRLEITLFRGTDTTGTRALNEWAQLTEATRMPDMTSTWYTTNDATFSLTGVQLEVGDTATNFEFKSFAEDLRECQRYCYTYKVTTNNFIGNTSCFCNSTSNVKGAFYFPVTMRTYPTYISESFNARFRAGNSSNNFNMNTLTHEMGDDLTDFPRHWGFNVNTSSVTGGQAGLLQGQAGGLIQFRAEY
tara:strand:- start:251 stop:1510 length:1260 start_codon:yes stop_codon:yes gene_type:complete